MSTHRSTHRAMNAAVEQRNEGAVGADNSAGEERQIVFNQVAKLLNAAWAEERDTKARRADAVSHLLPRRDLSRLLLHLHPNAVTVPAPAASRWPT